MKRIVILHEELKAQMLIYLALSEMYRVEIAEDEAALMRMIRRKRPSLVFLDADFSGFRNGGKSVYKTIQKIKRKYEALKIVTILKQAEKTILDEVRKKGSDGVLLHPIDKTEVVKTAARQLTTAAVAVN